jgi:hypothetical protein
MQATERGVSSRADGSAGRAGRCSWHAGKRAVQWAVRRARLAARADRAAGACGPCSRSRRVQQRALNWAVRRARLARAQAGSQAGRAVLSVAVHADASVHVSARASGRAGAGLGVQHTHMVEPGALPVDRVLPVHEHAQDPGGSSRTCSRRLRLIMNARRTRCGGLVAAGVLTPSCQLARLRHVRDCARQSRGRDLSCIMMSLPGLPPPPPPSTASEFCQVLWQCPVRADSAAAGWTDHSGR